MEFMDAEAVNLIFLRGSGSPEGETPREGKRRLMVSRNHYSKANDLQMAKNSSLLNVTKGCP